MTRFTYYRKKLQHTRHLLTRINPFLANILYFFSISLVGFALLKSLKPRTTSYKPKYLDLFFTSVSATTVSSMSVVEMEVFSNSQLIVMTILMLAGGEIFTSLVALQLTRVAKKPDRHHVELSVIVPKDSQKDINPSLEQSSIKFLCFVVLGYFVTIQVLGISSLLLYLSLVKTVPNVLKTKGINTFTFSVFTILSSFSNCGFMPTNENMIVFSKNSGLLLILIPQILLGSTLFPSFLRLLIWFLGEKIKFKNQESKYLLENYMGSYREYLLSGLHCLFLVATVFGLILVGFTLFWAMEWNSAALSGFSPYQKLVGVVFETVNARHAGETIVDLSAIGPAVLLFFVLMMYLPPYTSFAPIFKRDENIALESQGIVRKKRIPIMENLLFSQLSYLVIFIILVCITERKSIKDDPLNFSVLNIIFEVISAYGNVGFTTGYSCDRELRRSPACVNKWYGFSGKWSDEGKIIIIIVMFFGRLKKFSMNGGRAWKLS